MLEIRNLLKTIFPHLAGDQYTGSEDFKAFLKVYQFNSDCFLGKGAYGAVYKVTHIEKGDFALKVLEIERRLKNPGEEDKAKETAAREIRCLREANHVNVLRYHFAWYIDKLPSSFQKPDHFPTQLPMFAIQVELCTSNLRQKLSRHKPTEKSGQDWVKWTEDRKRWILELAAGIHYIHQCKIMHRDLNSENTFLKTNENGEDVVKIGDFGLSRTYHPGQTLTLECQGAEFYQSLEQRTQKHYSLKCDVYSMGVIFYEILHSEVLIPEDAAPLKDCLQNLMSVHEEPSTYEHIPDIPMEMNDLIKSMLQKEQNRPDSAAVWEQLEDMKSKF